MPVVFASAGLRQVSVPDGTTLAWVNAVNGDGGTVSALEQFYVDTLLDGLKGNGFFTRLDHLWLFASENQFQALRDPVGLGLATNVNSTTFTPMRGFTGNGSNMFINSNHNCATANGQYKQNSCCMFGWVTTAGSETGSLFGIDANSFYQSAFVGFGTAEYSVSNNAARDTSATSQSAGLWVCDRSGASAENLYLNGSSVASGSQASGALISETTKVLECSGNFSNRQMAAFGLGGHFTAAEHLTLYNLIRTYMTSVGVP